MQIIQVVPAEYLPRESGTASSRKEKVAVEVVEAGGSLQMPVHYHHLGEVRSQAGDRCLDTMSRKAGQKVTTSTFRKSNLPWQVGLSYCHGLGGNQVFALTEKLQVGEASTCTTSLTSHWSSSPRS